MSPLRILPRSATLGALAGVALLVGLTGCSSGVTTSSAPPSSSAEVNPSGDIPDNQAYVPYSSPDGRYTISVPEGWSQSTGSSAATFSDKLNSARFEAKKVPAAPTTATVRTSVVPALGSAHPGFSLVDVAPFARKGGSGILIRYQQDAPANTVTSASRRQAVEAYLFWKNGTEVEVTLTSPTGADNVDPWKKITDSFTWR
jgi:hypothetical protein